MNRTDFVIAFRNKDKNISERIFCQSCYLEWHTELCHISGHCTGLGCIKPRNTEKLSAFDNTIYIPVITRKECRHTGCRFNCDECVIYKRYKPDRPFLRL